MGVLVFSFSLFNCIIRVNSTSPMLINALREVYGAMGIEQADEPATLSYEIYESADVSAKYVASRSGIEDLVSYDLGAFIFLFEKDMTIELQRVRSDLFFMHAAVLEYKGKAVVIVAASGMGKSTTAWALLHSGFNYLSDELAPIDLTRMEVWPYPHALCLKARPPVYILPEETLETSRTMHVPTASLPVWGAGQTILLSAIMFLERDPQLSRCELKPLSTVESVAKIYANTLNALAHSQKGLDAAISIASQLHCYNLNASNDLEDTCRCVKRALDKL